MTSNLSYRQPQPPFRSRNGRQISRNSHHKQPQEKEWMNLTEAVSLAARKRRDIAEMQRSKEEALMYEMGMEMRDNIHEARYMMESEQESIWNDMKKLRTSMRKKRLMENMEWKNSFTRDEAEDEAWEMVDKMESMFGMGQGPQESYRAWRARLQFLNQVVHEIWAQNQESILASEPRYLEGTPVRDWLTPPTFMPHRKRGQTGLAKCLQCEVKGLQCSRVARLSGESNPENIVCRRCEDGGEKCLVKMKGETEWVFAGREIKTKRKEEEEEEAGDATGEKKKNKKKKKRVMFAREESELEKSGEEIAKEKEEEKEMRELVEELELRLKGVRNEAIGGEVLSVGDIAIPIWSNREDLQNEVYFRNLLEREKMEREQEEREQKERRREEGEEEEEEEEWETY